MKALVLDVCPTLLCEATPAEVARMIKLDKSSVLQGTNKKKLFVKRPSLDEFLQRVSTLFVVAAFMQRSKKYADKILSSLHPAFTHTFYLDSYKEGVYGGKAKDLKVLRWPMDQVIAIDEACSKCDCSSENVIVIPPFKLEDVGGDRELLKLLPLLEALAKPEVVDVRPAVRNRHTQGSARLSKFYQVMITKNPPLNRKVEEKKELHQATLQQILTRGHSEPENGEKVDEQQQPQQEEQQEQPQQEQPQPQEQHPRQLPPAGENQQQVTGGKSKALGEALLNTLRTHAANPDLDIQDDGFAKVDDLLGVCGWAANAGSYRLSELLRASKKSKMTTLVDDHGSLYVSAGQWPVEEQEDWYDELREAPYCVFGTSKKEVEIIMEEGLQAADLDDPYLVLALPGSPMARYMYKCHEVLLVVDFRSAMKETSMTCYITESGLLLTNHLIPAKYLHEIE